MKNYKVQDLMVPLSEYATVSEDATLLEAVNELEKAQGDFDHTRYRHRAVMVLDKNGAVIGKLSQLDVLKALEPKYDKMLDQSRLHRFGFTKGFMKSLLTEYQLFDRPLTDICSKAAVKNVKKFMYSPTEGEYIDENATLDEAIHQLVLGHHQSLLVTGGEGISGVLRLTDVFAAVFQVMKKCQV
ncbi:MAG: CBS domain-containing protein [Deltaproteobacteria bacterium]|nr:CBS domain-containing protein [Deltaproteobacteria bacterium]